MKIVVTQVRTWEADAPDIQSPEEQDAFLDLLLADAAPDSDDLYIETVP